MQVSDINLVGGVPRAKAGTIRLNFQRTDRDVAEDLAKAIGGVEAVILAVPHGPYLELEPEQLVKWAGGPIAVIDCFGILEDEKIRRYFELGCEVKALGRGHIQRIKEEVRKKSSSK